MIIILYTVSKQRILYFITFELCEICEMTKDYNILYTIGSKIIYTVERIPLDSSLAICSVCNIYIYIILTRRSLLLAVPEITCDNLKDRSFKLITFAAHRHLFLSILRHHTTDVYYNFERWVF